MQTEQLKLLIEAFNNLGENAEGAFYAYLGLQAFENICVLSALLGIAWLAYKAVRYLVDAAHGKTGMGTLRDMLGIGTGGKVSSWEEERVITRVKEMLMREKGE
jgi:hypothetical protein